MPATQPLPPRGGNAALPRPSISLVLPAWNEAEALPRAIAEARAALSRVSDRFEVLVVDDGSTDDTARVVLEAASGDDTVRLLRHETNRGYGAALRTGFAAARYERVAFTDADNQFDLSELDRFVLLAERNEVVCGYRIDRKDSLLRRVYSRGYNLMVRTLFGLAVRDVDCALKMFHRDIVRRLDVTTDGFLVNTELLTQARRLGANIVEVGVSHRPRVEGESTVSAWHIPHVLADLARYWWNSERFPGERAAAPTAPRWVDAASVLLVVATTLLLLWGAGYPLIDRDETRYAEIPREMIQTGDWVLPRLNFKPYCDKPPLLYWLCAASYRVLGVGEFAARLPQVLATVGTLVATLVFARRWFGPATGLAAAVVLLFSAGFLGQSRVLLIDGLLTFCTTVAVGCGFEAIRGPSFRRGWWVAGACVCALGALAKGPIALVLMAPPLAAYAGLTRGASRPRVWDWLALAAITAAPLIPWIAAATAESPGFAYEFLYTHHVARFGGAYHAEPAWFFLPVLLIGGHPWSFLAISLVWFLARGDAESRRRRPPELGLALLWGLWCLAFFSASKCKLPPYILPAAPPLAIAMAHYFVARVLPSTRSRLSMLERVAPWNAAIATGVTGVGFAIFAAATGFESIPFAVASGLLFAAAAAALQLLRRTDSQAVAWGASVAFGVVLGVFITHREIPRYARYRTIFGPGSPIAAEAAAAPGAAVVTYRQEWAEVPFYLRRDDIENLPADAGAPARVAELARARGTAFVLLHRGEDVGALVGALPADLHARDLGRRGRGAVLAVTAATPAVASAPATPPTRR